MTSNGLTSDVVSLSLIMNTQIEACTYSFCSSDISTSRSKFHASCNQECPNLLDGESFEIRGKLDDYIAKLPQTMFFRCHQSYVINLRHSTALTVDGFVLCNKVIPVSRSYQKEAIKRFSNSLISEFGEVEL